MKHFSAHLRAMVRSNHLPDYALTLEDGQAVFHKRLLAADKPTTLDIALAKCAPASRLAQRLIRVSQDAMDALYEVAPGFDRYWLESTYQTWAADKEPARSEDARFLAWARNFTKGRRT